MGLRVLLAGQTLLVLIIGTAGAAGAQAAWDWRSEWAVQRGFAVQIDTRGYDLPSSIAFVPRPGPAAKDPLYFVTELRGRVKVVTNDRSVFTFAEGFYTSRPIAGFGSPDTREVGLAGVCLDPEHGFVFVTFSRPDDSGVLRNNIVRFQSRPHRFSLRPTARVDFAQIFRRDQAIPSHQIGACQVSAGLLYVSVGDGGQPNRSRRLDSTAGKVLRLTLDGEPPADNPFRTDRTARGATAQDYVWARGFRNPFGMKVVESRVFVADNGQALDRFVRVDRGEDYLWAGSDAAIGTKAIAVLSPSNGLSQLDYHTGDAGGFPAGFYLSVSGSPIELKLGGPRVLHVGYLPRDARLVMVPTAFLRYQGSNVQVLASLAFGPDGLYLVPLLPNQEGVSAILKIVPDATGRYPALIDQAVDARTLLRERGCLNCHGLDRAGTTQVGPNLYPGRLVPRLLERLSAEGYAAALRRLDQNSEQPFVAFRSARRQVLQATGLERVRLWLRYRIIEPRFDSPASMMPTLGVPEREADIIAEHFLSTYAAQQGRGGLRALARRVLPAPARRSHLVAFFASGFALGAVVAASLVVLVRRFRGNTP